MIKEAHLSHLKQQASLLPETAGVYFFYPDKSCQSSPVYVGKSINLKQRVLSHIYQHNGAHKEQKILAASQTITYTQTIGELGALLLEASLVKRYQPLYNRKLRRMRQVCTIALNKKEGLLVPNIKHYTLAEYNVAPLHFGLFRSQRQALGCLQKLAKQHQLCLKALGLESGKGPCFGVQLKQCLGVCNQQETPEQHNTRLLAALAEYQQVSWPHAGPMEIKEHCAQQQKTTVHFVDQWRYLGFDMFDQHQHLIERHRQDEGFDIDHYKILVNWILPLRHDC